MVREPPSQHNSSSLQLQGLGREWNAKELSRFINRHSQVSRSVHSSITDNPATVVAVAVATLQPDGAWAVKVGSKMTAEKSYWGDAPHPRRVQYGWICFYPYSTPWGQTVENSTTLQGFPCGWYRVLGEVTAFMTRLQKGGGRANNSRAAALVQSRSGEQGRICSKSVTPSYREITETSVAVGGCLSGCGMTAWRGWHSCDVRDRSLQDTTRPDQWWCFETELWCSLWPANSLALFIFPFWVKIMLIVFCMKFHDLFSTPYQITKFRRKSRFRLARPGVLRSPNCGCLAHVGGAADFRGGGGQGQNISRSERSGGRLVPPPPIAFQTSGLVTVVAGKTKQEQKKYWTTLLRRFINLSQSMTYCHWWLQ